MRERVAIDGLCELLYDRAIAGPLNTPHLRYLLEEPHSFPNLHTISPHKFDEGVAGDIPLPYCRKLKDCIHLESQEVKGPVKASTEGGDRDGCLKVRSISDDLTRAIANVDGSYR